MAVSCSSWTQWTELQRLPRCTMSRPTRRWLKITAAKFSRRKQSFRCAFYRSWCMQGSLALRLSKPSARALTDLPQINSRTNRIANLSKCFVSQVWRVSGLIEQSWRKRWLQSSSELKNKKLLNQLRKRYVKRALSYTRLTPTRIKLR